MISEHEQATSLSQTKSSLAPLYGMLGDIHGRRILGFEWATIPHEHARMNE